MGEFIEPIEDNTKLKPKVFTEEFLTSVIKKSLENGDIREDDRLTFIAITDERGAKAIIAVSILNKENLRIKFNGVFEHEWDGDNRVGAKVVASFK